MKLSAAILKGSKMKPKTIGSLFECDEYGTLHSCALGAAVDAIKPFKYKPFNIEKEEGMIDSDRYAKKERVLLELLYKHFPVLKQKPAFPQDFGRAMPSDTIQELVQVMNDDLNWTREKIATFLASKGL